MIASRTIGALKLTRSDQSVGQRETMQQVGTGGGALAFALSMGDFHRAKAAGDGKPVQNLTGGAGPGREAAAQEFDPLARDVAPRTGKG